MVVGVLVGCGGDSPTGEEKRELLVWRTTWEISRLDRSLEVEFQYYLDTNTNRRIKHGWFNVYYPGGIDYFEGGTYKNDKKHGEWIERKDYCTAYDNLSPGLPAETYDFYFDSCVNGVEKVYTNGVCTEGCENKLTNTPAPNHIGPLKDAIIGLWSLENAQKNQVYQFSINGNVSLTDYGVTPNSCSTLDVSVS